MSKFTRALYSPLLLDVTFGVAGVGSAALLAFGPIVHRAPAMPVEYSETMGIILVGLVLATGLFATFTTRLDQKCADDFVFMMLAKSALIAVVTVIVVSAFWDLLFEANLGPLPGAATVPLVMLAWACGYFYTRIRGTVA